MNTTTLDGVAAPTADAQVSENVLTLMHRTRMRQQQLAAAIGLTPQTMSRRLAGTQPWAFWEVAAIARFYGVTLEELSGTLPTLGEWSVRHEGLEPPTRCFRAQRADLRVVA